MPGEIPFYGIRHGQTGWNKEQRIQGHQDQPLTAEGITSVHWVGQEMANRNMNLPVTLMYASDLSRALVTADILSQYLDVPYRVDARLRERNYGAFEGRTFQELESELGLTRIEGYHPPGGEPLEAFDLRIKSAVLDILSSNLGQTILFVSHGGALRSKMRQFGSVESEGIGFDLQNLSLHSFAVPELELAIGSAK